MYRGKSRKDEYGAGIEISDCSSINRQLNRWFRRPTSDDRVRDLERQEATTIKHDKVQAIEARLEFFGTKLQRNEDNKVVFDAYAKR